MDKVDLHELARACDRVAERARANLADRDAGRHEKVALLRHEIKELRRELDKV